MWFAIYRGFSKYFDLWCKMSQCYRICHPLSQSGDFIFLGTWSVIWLLDCKYLGKHFLSEVHILTLNERKWIQYSSAVHEMDGVTSDYLSCYDSLVRCIWTNISKILLARVPSDVSKLVPGFMKRGWLLNFRKYDGEFIQFISCTEQSAYGNAWLVVLFDIKISPWKHQTHMNRSGSWSTFALESFMLLLM